MNKSVIAAIAAVFVVGTLDAQITREEMYADLSKSAGLLTPYPGPQQEELTKAPRGYEPFYISHFGRHGSRWHTSIGPYQRAMEQLETAHKLGKLTPLGEDVLGRVYVLYGDAHKRIGELTPLGIEQHRDIADRMYHRHKGVFKKGRVVHAGATSVPRVMMSMRSFCNRLRECEPALDMDLNASGHCHRYTNRLTPESKKLYKAAPWKSDLTAFRDSLTQPDRLMSVLFNDPAYVESNVDKIELINNLYQLASISPNMPVDVRLQDIFTPEELYNLWQRGNASYYVTKGSCPIGGEIMHQAATPLLKDFIDKADAAIADGNIAADLRFSHDAYLTPLATIMQLAPSRGVAESYDDFASVWCDFIVSPMAGNIQWIFYKNRAGDVIVKFLLQEAEVDIPVETDIYPYYHWEDVKAFYSNQYNI